MELTPPLVKRYMCIEFVILQRRLRYLMRLSAVSPDSCNETHVRGIMYQNLLKRVFYIDLTFT